MFQSYYILVNFKSTAGRYDKGKIDWETIINFLHPVIMLVLQRVNQSGPYQTCFENLRYIYGKEHVVESFYDDL